MATAGIVAGESENVTIGVVPNDRDPNPTIAVWIGRDAVTEISLHAAEELAAILLGAVKVAKGQAELGANLEEPAIR